MSDEHSIIESGHRAVLAEVDRDNGGLNLDVLAQACGHKARGSSVDREEAIGWAAAAIACHRKTAERRSEGFDRQGSETILFGLMVLMILKWGPEVGNDVLDPTKVARWIQGAIDAWSSPADFGDALKGRDNAIVANRELALCLRERLEVGRALFDRGLLPASMQIWLEHAGLST